MCIVRPQKGHSQEAHSVVPDRVQSEVNDPHRTILRQRVRENLDPLDLDLVQVRSTADIVILNAMASANPPSSSAI